ncbi:MAG: hypothetical protein U0031_23035 [Thermomicrobiales bacterium]
MDNRRFDDLTRLFAEESTRRATAKGIAGGAAALTLLARTRLGLAQESDEVTVEGNGTCKPNDKKCSKDKDCCSKKCKKGKCKCAGSGAGCKRDQGCCSGVCRGSQCQCGDKGDDCRNDSDCCSRTCRNQRCRCIKQGDRCRDSKSCCSGVCNSRGFCN